MKSNNPLVSIITPVYNMEMFINKTIESVVNQTYTYWEFWLVDDCSTDASRDILKEWASRDSRIKTVYLQTNGGAGIARNEGLERAKGDYIAFLDSDDTWLPNKLLHQILYFKNNPKANFLYTWYNTIDENDNLIFKFVTPKRLSFNRLKFNNYILTSTAIYNRENLSDIRFPAMRRRQDWVLFLDILKRVKYAYTLPEVTVQYRKMPNTLSSNRFKLIMPNFEFFRNYFYKGNSILAFCHFIVFLPVYFHNKIFNKRKVYT